MARIRSVKPALRTSRVVARWPFEVRYFWVLLWGYLDDKGRGLDLPKAIAGDCFPLDDRIGPAVVEKWLKLMASTKVDDRDPPLCRYEIGGRRYLHSVNWDEHQRPNRPSPSQHPPCPIHEGLTESLTEPDSEPPLSPHVLELEYLTEGELEGAAREPITEPPDPAVPAQEPPSKCETHIDDPDPPPCGRCGALRKAREQWEADQHRADILARQQRARADAEVTRLAMAACRDCDRRGRLPDGRVCHHNPGNTDRAHRGAAAARAALHRAEEPA